MKKPIATLAVVGLTTLLIITSPSIARAQTSPTTKPASNTRYATRLLFWPQTKYVPMTDEVMLAVQQLAIAEGQEILGISAEQAKSHFSEQAMLRSGFESPESVDNQIRLIAQLPPGIPPRAKEWLDAVVAALPQAVGPLFDKARSQPLQAAHRAVDEAQTRYADAATKLQDLRNKIRSLAGREDVSPKSISDDVASLENQKQSLELDLAGKEARRDALTMEIAKQSKAIQAKVESDAIANELQKVVDARQEKVKTLKQLAKLGKASYTDLSDAVAAAADAEAKLLQRRHDAAAEAGGDALDSFNRELLTLSVDLREIQAKLDFINKRLSALSSANDQIDALTRAQDQAKSAGNDLDNAEAALRTVQQQVEGHPTGLTVTDSTNLPEPPQ